VLVEQKITLTLAAAASILYVPIPATDSPDLVKMAIQKLKYNMFTVGTSKFTALL